MRVHRDGPPPTLPAVAAPLHAAEAIPYSRVAALDLDRQDRPAGTDPFYRNIGRRKHEPARGRGSHIRGIPIREVRVTSGSAWSNTLESAVVTDVRFSAALNRTKRVNV